MTHNNHHKHHNHKKYKLVIFRWISGMLHSSEEFFDKLEDAIENAISSDAHSYKVYGRDGEVCHRGKKHDDCDDDDTYA
jgi:hypothetical protein